MSYGQGWGGSPWGGGEVDASSHTPVIFDVELDDVVSATSDVFIGLQQIPSVIAAAQSPVKIEVVFSVAMSIDSNFLNTASYTITQAEGSVTIPVLSVIPSGTLPLRRATLEVGIELDSKEYYFLTVSHSIVSLTGDPSNPDYTKFQWVDMTTPIFRTPLEIPIKDFSGEVHGGILGNPDGQVFFSPAYNDVSSTSTIEIEQLSVCTKAYDEYHLPNPPDPTPLLTWGRGITSVIGPTSVLWAPHDRLGLPRLDLEIVENDSFQPPFDFNTQATLVETIDITKGGGFLNDLRWATFPATGKTVFKTANNLAPIGPGPTTQLKLDWPKLYLYDSTTTTDQIVINAIDIEIDQDDLLVTDGLTVQNITPGLITISIDEAMALTDVTSKSAQYNRVFSETLSISDASTIEVSRANEVVLSDSVSVTDSTTISRVVGLSSSDTVSITDFILIEKGAVTDVSVSDTLSTTDATTLSLVYSYSVSDSVTTTDSPLLSLVYSSSASDTISVTDSVTTALVISLIDVDAGTDTISVIDSESNQIDKTLGDTISVTDSESNQVDKTLGDTVSVTDSVTATFEKSVSVSDTVAIEEVIWTGSPVQYHDTTFSPVGLWQFNETFNDTSGNGFNLTAETGTVAYGDIFPGVKGVILDGSTTLVYNTSTATLGRTGDITIEMLLNLNAYTASKFLVSYSNSSSGGSTTNALYAIEMLNGSSEFTFFQENGSNSASRTGTFVNRPTLNTLCHFALTRTSDVIKVYLNGVLVETSSALTTATGGSASVFRVGSHSSRGSAPTCAIASLKVVASALTGTQIAQEYNLTLGRYYGEI